MVTMWPSDLGYVTQIESQSETQLPTFVLEVWVLIAKLSILGEYRS